MKRAIPFSTLFLALAASTALAGGPQSELFVLGKPVVGGSVRVETSSPPGSLHWLLVDASPGPVQLLGALFEVGFSPSLLVVGLGVASQAPATVVLNVPNKPALVGATVYLQSAAVSLPAQLFPSNGVALTFGSALGLADVDDFLFQLQGPGDAELDLDPISATAFDACVIDFSSDGAIQFSAAQIAGLKSSAEPERIQLAYMSIGEAEDYRWYWPVLPPALVAGANPMWPNNFKALYWEPQWKQVILSGGGAYGASYLDRIIDQGFDGVYLDIIDAFEFFGPAEAGGEDARRNAAEEMVQFVAEIAFHARVLRGRANFLIVPQNGANLFEHEWYPKDTLGPEDPQTPAAMAALQEQRYFATIDAIGCENLFHPGPADEDNPFAPDGYLLGILDAYQAAGLPVWSIEYLTQQAAINAFYDIHAPAAGFVPFATVIKLDQTTIHPGQEPD